MYITCNIGARDFVTEGTFTWSDGSSNAFASTEKTVWGGTLPGTTANTNDWVYITSGGTWTESASSTTKYVDSWMGTFIIPCLQIAGHLFARGKTMSSWVH